MTFRPHRVLLVTGGALPPYGAGREWEAAGATQPWRSAHRGVDSWHVILGLTRLGRCLLRCVVWRDRRRTRACLPRLFDALMVDFDREALEFVLEEESRQ